MKFKILLIPLVLLVTFAAVPASANECDAEIANVDKEFVSTNPLSPDVLAEARTIRDQAYTLCVAGQVAEGLALLEQAKALLGIQ